MLPSYSPPTTAHTDATSTLVEAVDAHDRPLAVMDLRHVHAQRLMHRSVAVIVYDTDNRVYLQKRSRTKSAYPGRWDVSAFGHVRAGQSRQQTAHDTLRHELGLQRHNVRHRLALPASVQTGWEFVSIYTVAGVGNVPAPNADEVSQGVFYDRTELSCLVDGFRELLTPGLVALYEMDVLFTAQTLTGG